MTARVSWMLGALLVGICGCSGAADTKVGNPCESSAECDDLICGPLGLCQKGEAGDSCTTQGDCAYDPANGAIYACSLVSNECFAADCRSTEDCSVGESCDLGTYTCAERRCTGSAWSCSTISSFSCATVPGCYLDGSCGGYAGSCYSQYSSYSCNALDGCYWSTYYDDCSGSAWSCSTYSTEFSCEGQGSCYWTEDCGGVATPCSVLSEYECEDNPGCTWSVD